MNLLAGTPKKLPWQTPGAGPEHNSVELADVVSIRQFRDLPEALLAKGALDSAEIESFLVDDNMIRMDWFYSNLVGGIKLCVKQEDAEAALDLLEQSIPEEFEVEGVGQYEQPRCPKCQSLDIAFEDLNQPVAWISAYLLAPIRSSSQEVGVPFLRTTVAISARNDIQDATSIRVGKNPHPSKTSLDGAP